MIYYYKVKKKEKTLFSFCLQGLSCMFALFSFWEKCVCSKVLLHFKPLLDFGKVKYNSIKSIPNKKMYFLSILQTNTVRVVSFSRWLTKSQVTQVATMNNKPAHK